MFNLKILFLRSLKYSCNCRILLKIYAKFMFFNSVMIILFAVDIFSIYFVFKLRKCSRIIRERVALLVVCIRDVRS